MRDLIDDYFVFYRMTTSYFYFEYLNENDQSRIE